MSGTAGEIAWSDEKKTFTVGMAHNYLIGELDYSVTSTHITHNIKLSMVNVYITRHLYLKQGAKLTENYTL